MKTIWLLLVTFAVLSHATEKPYFIYGDVHALSGYPMIGVGVRTQKGMHALDFSANACPVNPPMSLYVFHLRSLYLAYPKQTGFYFGGGLGILNEPETIKVSGSFESTIGYQWKNRIFIEGHGIVPFKQSPILSPVWPGLYRTHFKNWFWLRWHPSLLIRTNSPLLEIGNYLCAGYA